MILAALPEHDDEQLVYWKTDSTLRGPIGACFQALLDSLPGRKIVYVPAYPAVGRTARNGVLRIHGRPVAETEFGCDPLNPIRNSSIPEIAADGCSAPIRLAAGTAELRAVLETPERCVVVCDSETDEEIAAIIDLCRSYARSLVLAGPAGGIRNWALWLGGSSSELTVMPPAGRWLVVCGSRHPVSRAQAQAAAELGFDVITTPLEDSPLGAAEAQWFATAAADTQARAMMIFGGDTVLAVCRKLGIESLTPLGEVLPGVAVSRSGSRVFVTKAGGYGEPDLVERVVERWRT